MRQSAISSASFSAAWMLCTVASMLTTTPRFKPWLAETPRPASLSSPLDWISATTTMILAVPISSPTTRSLYSLAMFVSVLPGLRLRGRVVINDGGHPVHAQGVTIGITQVHRLQCAGIALGELTQRGSEAVHPLQQLG